MIAGIRNKGYRFRVYLFAGFMVFLVLTSFAYTIGVTWYSKNVTAMIVEKDFRARNIERSLFDLLLSMDRNRKKYVLLEKVEYKTLYERDAEKFKEELANLKTLNQTEEESRAWEELKKRFESYLQKDPLSAHRERASPEGLSGLPLEEINRLLRLNQDRIDLRIAAMSRLEGKTFQVGLFWAVLSLLVAFVSSVLLIRSITKPIKLLQNGTREIAEGRFSHRVDLERQDELGELADAFNQMALQLKKLDDMKNEFMAMVSHELRTPLTSMKEAVELLQEETVGPLNEKQKNLLRINASGMQKLGIFVDDILNLTRMEGGLAPLYSTWFDFEVLLEEKLNTFRLLADKKQIQLSSVYHPDPFPRVFGDVERLKQVLANLLNNAILFTPSGGDVTVEAETVSSKSLPADIRESLRKETAKTWLRVKVSDTGEGIPKEEAKRVFDKFYQIKNSSGFKQMGCGLGLTIAKHIVEAHGGTIWVEISPQPGATMTFVVPQEGRPKDRRPGREGIPEREQEAPLSGIL